MEKIAVARKLRNLDIWISKQLPEPGNPEHVCIKALIGDALVSVNPAMQSQFPSANKNRIQFFGVELPPDAATLDVAIKCFAVEGVNKFFFWLSPGAHSERIESWLLMRGFVQFRGTSYPTLLRAVDTPPPHPTDLDVRSIDDPSEIAEYHDAILDIYQQPEDQTIFLQSAGCRGFVHFMAFHGLQPVAASMLIVRGDFAYLGYAATLEEFRRRGAQNAMIAARLRQAAELGCTWAAAETLNMLKTSLGNLLKNGFEVVYEKKVFGWSAEKG